MLIDRFSSIIPIHPLPGREPARERPDAAGATPPPAEEAARVSGATRAAAAIRQPDPAWQYQRRGAREFTVPPIEDPRNRHALDTYEAVRDGQARDYVSQIFGVDAYA